MSTERNHARLIPDRLGNEPISEDQGNYLDGFFAGLRNRGLSFAEADPNAGPKPLADSAEGSGKKEKLTAEEKIKREEHPFDAFDRLRANAKHEAAPAKEDVFRFKWNGLFWLAPVHEGYMCRLRIPGGRMRASQLKALGNVADDLASGYLQLTTRSNVQIRVIAPKDAPELLRRVQDCGLQSRGSGADNLRNFTGSPTAGIDPHELIDVQPFVDDLAHRVVNQLEFYDLPRKFNISFDGGGLVPVAEDTNDIGLKAIRLKEAPEGHPLHGRLGEGVHFQVMLGGITGHKAFAEEAGLLCRPEDAVDLVLAMTRVYLRHGNRGNRGKARLIYLLQEWGLERFLEETEALLEEPLLRFRAEDAIDAALIEAHEKPREPHPQVGVYPQRQAGHHYIGVSVPVGILQSHEARAIADIADTFGDGEIRLTIFQNLLLSGVPDEHVEEAKSALERAGLGCSASYIRGGAAACTGNQYCKYAASDTKRHTMELVDYLEKRVELDTPINIHTTGCPHSCAQHYIGDLGLLACKVAVEGEDDPVEGYHVFVGGGFGDDRRLGRQLFKSVPAGSELYGKVAALLEAYLEHREPDERFVDFATRHEIEALEAMTAERLGGVSESVSETAAVA